MDPEEFAQFIELDGHEPGTTPEQYCQHSCRDLMLTSVHWQLQAFATGFLRVAGVPESWSRLVRALDAGSDRCRA